MKKKIIFFARDLNIGGIEKSLINLLNNLTDDYDVTLVLENDVGELKQDLSKNVTVIEYKISNCKIVPLRKIINFTRRCAFLKKHKDKYDFSCAYATYLYSASVLSRACSKNNCLYVHNDYSYIYDEVNMREFFDSRKIEEFNKIIFVANESKDNFCKFYPDLEDKTLVINNIVNIEEIKKKSKESIDIKRDEKNKVFAFCGRLDEHQKKISRLLEIFKILALKHDDIALWIIGGGEEFDKTQEFIRKNSLTEKILLLGMQKNPYKFMSKADYLIITSDYEGFPVVFNEANILGKPMLSTLDITDDYYRLENGYGYVIPKDIKACAEKIEEILKENKEIKKIDYDLLNNQRVRKIKEVIENEV